MSHLICSKIRITDLEILKKAVAGFKGLKWNEGAKQFVSYGDTGTTKSEFGTCEHSITIEGATFQIGVAKLKDGTGYGLLFDPYDGIGASKVGRECELVSAAYGEAFVRDFAERNGFMVEQTTDSEGNLQLELISTT